MLSNGTDYQIDWPKFQPGTSIFIPAIDTAAALEDIKKEAQRLEFEYVCKVLIEDGIKGVRIWRI